MRNKEELIQSAGSGISDRVIIEILADIRDEFIKLNKSKEDKEEKNEKI